MVLLNSTKITIAPLTAYPITVKKTEYIGIFKSRTHLVVLLKSSTPAWYFPYFPQSPRVSPPLSPQPSLASLSTSINIPSEDMTREMVARLDVWPLIHQDQHHPCLSSDFYFLYLGPGGTTCRRSCGAARSNAGMLINC